MQQLYCEERGQGDQVVIFLPGFLEDHRMWKWCLPSLEKKYKLLALDLLGHGKTPSVSEEHSTELQAEAVYQLMQAKKIKKACFIGHSMGGYVALALAEAHPECIQGVSLFFSHTLADTAMKKKKRLEAINAFDRDKDKVIHISIPALFHPTQRRALTNEISQARQWAKTTPLEGIKAALRGMRSRKDRTFLLSTLSCPFQILLGEYDPTFDVKAYAEQLPKRKNIQLEWLPVGHMGHLEAPEESLEKIQSFLTSLFE